MARFYEKTYKVFLDDEQASAALIKALDCKTRRDILRLLGHNPMSIGEIAQALNMPISTISEHVKILCQSGIVTIFGQKNERGRGKVVTRQYENVQFAIWHRSEKEEISHSFSQQIPIGSYTDFYVHQYCGMLNAEGAIGCQDNINIFYSPIRHSAQLIWFDYGYVEYTIPILEGEHKDIIGISVSLELCSEAPGFDENWKSDVFFELNGKEVCLYTSPGDFGARPGKLTPGWWRGCCTSYGLMKNVDVNQSGTFLDGNCVSNVTIEDLNLGESPLVKLRIGVREDAKNRGGLNLFGKKFGDYPQHIIFTVTYEK